MGSSNPFLKIDGFGRTHWTHADGATEVGCYSIIPFTKVWIFYWDLSIMLRLNWQDNFKFPTQRLSQIMRDFGLRVICLIRLKIILPSLNLFLGADKSISVMKLRNKWFLAKLHSFIGVCKISYIKHVLSTKKSPLQLSALS